MANFFDQFDQQPTPAGNYFDQFDQPKESGGGFGAAAMDFIKSIPRGMVAAASSAPNPSMVPMQDYEMETAPLKEKSVNALLGTMHQPEGRAGRVGEAVGSGLGSPLSYLGPGSLPLKIGGAALASAGSEAAGQAAEGTPYEGPARVAGALAGGVTAAKALGPSAPKAAAPNYDELKGAAVADYNAARASGLEVDPKGIGSFAATTQQELAGPLHGFTGGKFGDAPRTMAILSELQNSPAGATVTGANLDALRKNLARLSRETSEGKPTPDAAAASVVLGRLNSYSENIPQGHVLAGSAEDYVRSTQQGNANYAAAQRLRSIDLKRTRAENNAEGGIATSLDNQLKSQMRTILNNPSAQRGFSPEELAAIQGVNKGTPTANFMRQIGRGGAGVIPTIAHLATATATGGSTIPLQAALATALYGARKGAESSTVNQVEKLAELLGKRSPLYQSRVDALPPRDNSPQAAALIRALMQAQH